MPRKGVSIVRLMKVTAIVAVTLAWICAAPDVFQNAVGLFLLVALDLVLVQAIVLKLPLRAFHYAFLIAGIASSIGVAVLADSRPVPGTLHILETLIRWHRAARGEATMAAPYAGYPLLEAAEPWVTALIGVLPAWAAAVAVAFYVKRSGCQTGRSGRAVAGFFQGLVFGLNVFGCGSALAYLFGSPPPKPYTTAFYIQIGALPLCLLVGGMLVAWAKLYSLDRGCPSAGGWCPPSVTRVPNPASEDRPSQPSPGAA